MAERRTDRWIRGVTWGLAAILLALPWVAMQFTGEVHWTVFDFLVFGLMLLLLCGGIEIALRVCSTSVCRLASGTVLLALFLLTWASLAVGLFAV
jgi:hypothetical protein